MYFCTRCKKFDFNRMPRTPDPCEGCPTRCNNQQKGKWEPRNPHEAERMQRNLQERLVVFDRVLLVPDELPNVLPSGLSPEYKEKIKLKFPTRMML